MKWVDFLNTHVLWGVPMVVLLLGTGVYLTVLTRGVLFRRFGTVLRETVGRLFGRSGNSRQQTGQVTPFQAVCTALAATVGTGNIVGVALAIATGGPGALFWLWVSALLGMVVKYSEVTLAVVHRTVNGKGETVGGPMYYLARGLGWKKAGWLFALFGVLASFGIGASVQANALTAGVQTAVAVPGWGVGVVAAGLAALVLLGGIHRIARVAEILVPFIAGGYIVGALAVLAINAKAIPAAFTAIFQGAFTGTAATGGFLGAGVGYACRVGIARGVFTHEAGMGSAPIAHAPATTDHPARQGLWGAFEVFLDSLVLCTVTGLVILTSGLWTASPPLAGDVMSAAAFGQALPGGQYIVTGGLVLFSFATVIAWYYYGEKCSEYLLGNAPFLRRGYTVVYVLCVFAGCVMNLDTVWALADLCNGLMAVPNLLGLLALSPQVERLTEEFFQHRLGR